MCRQVGAGLRGGAAERVPVHQARVRREDGGHGRGRQADHHEEGWAATVKKHQEHAMLNDERDVTGPER